ncbi:sodium-coupled neutral amino acid transporter 3-like isoform X1 [Solea senegalensis]|uniref:Sodium-coupled neutral amino acid transporter 3-like isoform X1 n=1 Tax=Solea senegalensis TaxID=28829 RepID=A0AAV6RZ27_SOLSE|nr:sodium-coupled neutral amino acid transporter 3-like isoform X1 [Solea senegalensis]
MRQQERGHNNGGGGRQPMGASATAFARRQQRRRQCEQQSGNRGHSEEASEVQEHYSERCQHRGHSANYLLNGTVKKSLNDFSVIRSKEFDNFGFSSDYITDMIKTQIVLRRVLTVNYMQIFVCFKTAKTTISDYNTQAKRTIITQHDAVEQLEQVYRQTATKVSDTVEVEVVHLMLSFIYLMKAEQDTTEMKARRRRMKASVPPTAYTIPILAFAFVCHPEVLPIYTELRNPTKKKMQHVSNISIAVMYVMYFLAALFGYLTFYGEVEAELLHTYSRIDPYDTLILCVRVAVLTAVTLTVPIVLFPVRRAIQQMLFPNKTFYWPRHIAIAAVLLTFINLLVIFAPNILGIFGIIGATSAPCLIFIFPAVFYIRIVPKEEEPMRSVPKILAACFAGIGFLFMIMSLSFIIIDWTSGSSKASSGH